MYRLILTAVLLCAATTAVPVDHKPTRKAASDQARLDAALSGLVPGKPQQ